MIKQDILEKQVNFAYLSLGSNLGNRVNNLEMAKYKLIQKGVKIIVSSSYYETHSWPNPKNPKFYNIVLKVKTKLNQINLLSVCKEIEKYLGRKKSPKNSPRECDIDILDYNNMSDNKGLKLPHPRMHNRNFVLIPLFEINRNWKHPLTKQHIKTLIFLLSNREISSIKQI